MDRCAIFIDAGYLLTEVGKLCLSCYGRGEVECKYPQLLEALGRFATDHCQLPLLRTYWYDAARDGIPTFEQQEIAGLPRVKIRLGRLVMGKQKGVDSMMVRDLITLARDRAVATMFLLSGDEDLREGVMAAQEVGVMVVVLGVPPGREVANQATSLVREADEHIVLEQSFWDPFFSKAMRPHSLPSVGNAGEALHDAGTPEAEGSIGSAPHRCGQEFAALWRERATLEEIRSLVAQRPVIPKELDARLLMHGEQVLGVDLRERQNLKRLLRAGFWSSLTES